VRGFPLKSISLCCLHCLLLSLASVGVCPEPQHATIYHIAPQLLQHFHLSEHTRVIEHSHVEVQTQEGNRTAEILMNLPHCGNVPYILARFLIQNWMPFQSKPFFKRLVARPILLTPYFDFLTLPLIFNGGFWITQIWFSKNQFIG
jgi:hypothetical protein